MSFGRRDNNEQNNFSKNNRFQGKRVPANGNRFDDVKQEDKGPTGKRKVFGDEEFSSNQSVETKRPKLEESSNDDGGDSQFKPKREYHKDSRLKAWRLIIRNIPWKTRKEDMQNVCSNFGPFTEIVLPPSKKQEGTCAGFGFVQFKKKEDAEKARDHFNKNKFLGRMVAADWCLNKDTYETTAHDEKEKMKKIVKIENTEEDKKNVKTLEESDQEDEESDESEDEEEEPVKASKSDKKAASNNKNKEKKTTRTDSAIQEGRVVFLRSLSFDTDADKLKEEMKRFGKVELALICKFKESGHSKGTAFVHFSTSEEANACITAVEEGLMIDNRLIKANQAMPREEAQEMEKDKLAKIPKDNRNLRLLRFGLVRDGTAAAKGMSKEDATKREKLAEASRKKLENSNMFVSPTRLCVHNLPQRVNDNTLRELIKKSISPEARILECRVWMDKNRLNKEGKPKSSGFSFVAFEEHKHALECLQALNNNPDTFSNEKRPIVEFSIENIMALQAKARRSSKSKGEEVSDKQLSSKIKQQVKQSIGEVHAAGMKFLPKFLGKKNRHRDLTGKAKRKVQARAKAKAAKYNKETAKSTETQTKKKKNKKDVTKYLSLST